MSIEIILSAIILLTILFIAYLVALIFKNQKPDLTPIKQNLQENKIEIQNEIRTSRTETNENIQSGLKLYFENLISSQKQVFDNQDKRLAEFNIALENIRKTVQENLLEIQKNNDIKLEQMRESQHKRLTELNLSLEEIKKTIQDNLLNIQKNNDEKLEQMRKTVDEKLEETLNKRISESFQMVNDRLEQVHKGLGEMQTLATGVGDLKKVLSNVKNRGIMGEIQLGAILEEMLSPEQYEKNVVIKKSTRENVEYAVKLPGDGNDFVYLPIDSKFPMEDYNRLIDAYESGSQEDIESTAKGLESAIKKSAKDIKDKYIDPPNSTDFAIMFLPSEGLYSEVVRRGLIDILQKDYKINIAGPTTMAALLNSLQMGFRTLAIQKRSSEVWKVLSDVKKEFSKFEEIIIKAQRRLKSTSDDLEELVGTRTRAINRKLKDVESLPIPDENSDILELADYEPEK